MTERQRQDTTDRTGEYGGDDGALEHERALIAPGEDPGTIGTPTGQPAQSDKTQAERKERDDLASGEENPG